MNSLVLKHLPGGAWDPGKATIGKVIRMMSNSYVLHNIADKSVPALPGPTLSQAVFVKVLESREGIEVQRS